MFVADLDAAVRWYTDLLGTAPSKHVSSLAVWQLPSTRLTLHVEDEYNTGGASAAGTVAYFDVDDADAAAAHAEALGAVAHRGPKTVFSGERLVQILDPFGNLIGFRQPPSD